MTDPRCPKCHASKAHLQALIERLEITAVQTVRCTLCGWRISRQLQPPKIININVDTGLKKVGRPQGKTGAAPCSVLGCSHRPTAGAPYGMCAKHRKMMKQWKQSAGRYTCPFETLPEGGYAQLARAQRRQNGRL